MTDEHPINSKNWWHAYGEPNTAVKEMSVDELAGLYSSGTPGVDFVVIDVRRADLSEIIPGAINLPSQSLPATLPSLVHSLSNIKKFIFHCNSCQGRGPRSAGWFADALNKHLDHIGAHNDTKERVYFLKGGINAWKDKFGTGELTARGKAWDGKTLSTIQFDVDVAIEKKRKKKLKRGEGLDENVYKYKTKYESVEWINSLLSGYYGVYREYLDSNGFGDNAKKFSNQGLNLAKTGANSATTFAGDIAKRPELDFSLPRECDKSADILKSFLANPDDPSSALNSIPKAVLQRAKGLAVFRIVKAGFIVTGRAGSGVVIARLDDGTWSAPSCIATGGIGWGLAVGADITDFVVVLNSKEAVESFAYAGNLTIGGNISASAGPIGTGGGVQAALSDPSPLFSYSMSRGLFAGVSLEGTAIMERKDTNSQFYGTSIPAKDILLGRIPPPQIAEKLYTTIEAAEQVDESGLPSEAYVPPPPEVAAGGKSKGQMLFDASQ
ncbi:DUF500-domain-containing protein [Wallemia mellicola]|nr:DUF500-domain-containing protein [Wallemia mellicola]TIB85512.1 DUF500-domain-containing protein [Wallemia mellicola]TIC39177.1 DUF500-domain-containing protein [Wallemia mellicola]TIC47327.1 DUF500-domain-containing protein [Wallemia mellicola]